MIFHHYNDTLEAPHATTNEAGNLTWQENYAPYNKKLENEHAELSNHIGYTGKPHQRITGFTYLNARDYDPIIGRFMAVDPVQYSEMGVQYFQRYSYADNNPYKYTDPSGETLIGNLIGFAFGFALEASIQSIEGDYDLGGLVASAALGAVTSGIGLTSQVSTLNSLTKAALDVSLDTASTAAVNAAKGDDIDLVDLAMGAIGGKAAGSLAKKNSLLELNPRK